MPRKGELRVWADEHQFLLQRYKVPGADAKAEPTWEAVSYHATLNGLAHSLLHRQARRYVVQGQGIIKALEAARQDVIDLLGELDTVVEVRVVEASA